MMVCVGRSVAELLGLQYAIAGPVAGCSEGTGDSDGGGGGAGGGVGGGGGCDGVGDQSLAAVLRQNLDMLATNRSRTAGGTSFANGEAGDTSLPPGTRSTMWKLLLGCVSAPGVRPTPH